MDSKVAFASDVPGGFWVNVFEDLSYSAHAIPSKKEYPKMKASAKMTTRNVSVVLDSLENISNPRFVSSPRTLKRLLARGCFITKLTPNLWSYIFGIVVLPNAWFSQSHTALSS